MQNKREEQSSLFFIDVSGMSEIYRIKVPNTENERL